MKPQREDLAKRSREVATYIRFVGEQQSLVSHELLCTMRASAFLLIYNMVESTARALTGAVVDQVKAEALSLSDLSPALRREFLRQASKQKAHYRLVTALEDRSGLVASWYDDREAFSGNVDAETIRARLIELGCRDRNIGSALKIPTKIMGDLLDIRNDLAHGNKTFQDVGADYDHIDLIKTFNTALRILRYALREVESLIVNRAHLTSWPLRLEPVQ